jgi:peptidoglycan/xylan/chitin deacetylase (PgdA/CDA1 family)
MAHKTSILTYHSIDGDGSVLSTAPQQFDRQMQYLRENSFESISASEVATLLHHGSPIPDGKVCLVFDDGFRNIYSKAFPILLECGFTATIFLVAGYCGRYNNWPGNLKSLKPSSLLSWSEAKEMKKFGIDFGSHSATHPDLTTIPIRDAESEIVGSKREIEDRLGESVDTFAYPYGRYNRQIKDIVRNHFVGACSTRLGNVRTGADRYAMRRIDVWFLSPFWLFKNLRTAPVASYLYIRQALREIKILI